MSSTPKSRGTFGPDSLPFLVLLVARLPAATAKYDRYRNGPSEDMGLGMPLAMLWLGGFWLFGIILSISSLNRPAKRGQSPAVPFIAVILHVGSIFSLFLWWLLFAP